MTNSKEDEVDDSNSSNELPILLKKRSAIKRNMKSMKTRIGTEKASSDFAALECRLQIIESYFKEISDIQTQIETINCDDSSRAEIEELYILIKSKIVTLLEAQIKPAATDLSALNTSLHTSLHQNRLPTLKLPKFDGKYAEYKRFFRTFSNMVHEEPSIPIVDKFNYLLSCLSGPALSVVEAFQVTEANYPKALQRLKERYDNNVLIFRDYIMALFNIPVIKSSNPVLIRNVIDTVATLRSSLLSLGSDLDIMNSILIHIVITKIDPESRTVYNKKQDFEHLPTWDDCYKILSHHCQYLESCTKRENPISNTRDTHKLNTKASTFVNAKTGCTHCNSADHLIHNCSPFLALAIPQRFEFAKRNGLCINCLRKGHTASKCQSKSRCRVCCTPHHTLLHFNNVSDNSVNAVQFQQSPSKVPPPSASSSTQDRASSSDKPHVSLVTRACKRALIPTAVILIQDKFGVMQPIRALLDSCSELNFITEETAKRLQLKPQPLNQEVSGISEIRTKLNHCISATIKSRISDFTWFSDFAITKSIAAQQPLQYVDTRNFNIPIDIKLADPLFFKPQRIEMLINAEIFFACLLNGKISLGPGLPCLQNTAFGWIAGGGTEQPTNDSAYMCNVAISATSPDVDHFLKRFWEIEEFPQSNVSLSNEELQCEKHFLENVAVLNNGRLQVRLPFKTAPSVLGNSYENAKKRFILLERRLTRNNELKQMYEEFMTEYEELGHMSRVDNVDLTKPHFVIPHHYVMRPDSTTTKLRVVFDGSARTSSNTSLNDILLVGATIQQDLIITLLSFRLHRYAITADVSKMYRQFVVKKEDRCYQLIIWRKNVDEPLQLFELNTITYGLASSPFLAIRSLFHIADLHSKTHPLGASVIKRDFYVDDLLTGADSLSEVINIKTEVNEILSLAGLRLSKWSSNCPQVIETSTEEFVIKTNENCITKTLGMSWKPTLDTISFRYDLPQSTHSTKRGILSIIARIFDVLGLLSPIVIRGKILLQETWIKQLKWDEVLPADLMEMWENVKADLSYINTFELPRFVFTSLSLHSEIHGFADASQRAYGCCLYVRTKIDGAYKTTLLVAKSKVAPIKVQSLPRLELCAVVLLVKTWQKIADKIINYTKNIFFWTDSEIVLQWLKTHSNTLNCFVANRVSEVQSNSKGITWRHVPSKDNPADLASRGCSASKLENTIWFTGPQFLNTHISKWPATKKEFIITDQILESKKRGTFKVSANTADVSIIDSVVERNSSFQRILRIMSYVFRIPNKLSFNSDESYSQTAFVPPQELENTFWKIVANIQSKYYASEIKNLQVGKAITPSLQKLTPFLHKMQIDRRSITVLRVGGRLANAPIPYDARFPALLPKDHRFSKLFIEHLHRKNLHAGAKVLIGLLREKVWIVNVREIVRKVLHECVHCFHYKPKLMEQIMADLPADRLRQQRPFLISGVDFCGPFATSYRLRGRQPYKTYIAIFVCFSSKAIHAELVSDLSTNNFLLCLKRFVGRRGLPQRIYCDNATNFVGAHGRLKELQKSIFSTEAIEGIMTYSNNIGFTFSFIPPRAPHFGGLWEAAVKSMKTILIKNTSSANLTYEELQTVVIEVEAILNSRPLVALSDDPNDGEALTPGHLLIGASLLALPDNRFEASQISRITQWQRITYLKQRFWQLWLRDYVRNLQQRSKWLKPQSNIELGQLVVVHEDNLPPQQWLLGRITQAFPGADGKIRVVEIKTSKGILRRPVQKVAPLPVAS